MKLSLTISSRLGVWIAVLGLVAGICCADEFEQGSVMGRLDAEPIQLLALDLFGEEDSAPSIPPEVSLPIQEDNTSFGPESPIAEPPIEVPQQYLLEGQSDGTFKSPLDIKITEVRGPRKLSNHYLMYREDNTGTEIITQGQAGMGLTTIAFAGSVLTEGDKSAFWIDPRFEWTFVNGPVQVDLPPQLFELTLACNAIAKTELVDLHFYFAPMLATDFDNYSADAWRFLGGAMAIARISRQWQLMGGAIYLDRPDLPVMPHAGALWRPADNVEFDFVFPNPRLAVCFDSERDDDSWMYCGMNISGGSWAYERLNSTYDRVGYLDTRLVMGFEHRDADLISGQWEIGYVFNRRIELKQTGDRLDLPSSFMIRWAGSY